MATAPSASSGLARHSSIGPSTPKAGTPSTMRAGSVQPRGSQKIIGAGKKVAPHKQSARKGKPGKSGLSRVKSLGIKNSPSSTNDSELSDAESGSVDEEDEVATPPPNDRNNDKDEEIPEYNGLDFNIDSVEEELEPIISISEGIKFHKARNFEKAWECVIT